MPGAQANITLKQRHAGDGFFKLWAKRILSQPLSFLIHVGHRYLAKLMLTSIECAVELYLGLIHSPQARLQCSCPHTVFKHSGSCSLSEVFPAWAEAGLAVCRCRCCGTTT